MSRWYRVFLALLPSGLPAQSAQDSSGASAYSYLARYRAVTQLAPIPDRVVPVHHLVLQRDVGRITLEQGELYPLAAIGGRTVGAVFRGRGRFTLRPPIATEQAELQRWDGAAALDDTITEAILLFADTTGAQFDTLPVESAPVPGVVADHVHDLINSLKGDNEGSFDRAVIGALLNESPNGFFLARIARTRKGPLLLEVDPGLNEGVRLLRPVSHAHWGANWAVVTQFPRRQSPSEASGPSPYRERLAVFRYTMDITLSSTPSANLDFTASATLSIVAREPIGPWVSFGLHPKLLVDSARWGGGEPAIHFKAKEGDNVWVRAPRRLQTDDTLALTVYYHGEHGGLIDRYGSWFYIDPSAAWYPTNEQGRDWATFDLTFHSPSWYPLASVGEQTDSSVSGRILTTHWVTRQPTSVATFNLGLFENSRVQQADAPPLDVFLSEEGHRELRRTLASAGIQIPEQRHMQENVATDVSNSLKLFARLFGECLYSHFYVTEIPYAEGVSFPGMIDLSWATFQNTTVDGFDEFFRAHEVAHQWWGNGVQPGSYRDAWLSEGLATFSGLWYLQAMRKHNTEYFRFLDQYKADIRDHRADTGPIWVGYRTATPDVQRGYDVMVYEKGAWVFHMLRILMLDTRTMGDGRFIEMMRDFYSAYRGKTATTEDFRAIVERHAGVPMDWFFEEWVKGTAIPAYHVTWNAEPAGAGRFTVHLHVSQDGVPSDFQMFVLVSVDLGGERFARFRMPVRGPQADFVSPVLPSEPKGLVFNDLHSVLADVKMDH